jgi:type IV pilus assembly protein PilP
MILRRTSRAQRAVRLAWLVAAMSGVALAVACEGEQTESGAALPKPTLKNAGNGNAANTATANEQPKAPTYSYSPVGKRDPFRSYFSDAKQDNPEADGRVLEETEKFELDQYKLTGLISGTSQPMAMVEDPTGRGHVLKIGSRLGKNGGRVTRVTGDQIVVTEEFRDPTGQRIRVPITVKLPKPELKYNIEGQ